MSRSSRGVDLSFLNGEEARQILKVLERDSQLKRAERERLSKLQKKKEDTAGFPGVSGELFEDIQKRKFQSDTDVSRMPKQPVAHQLKKATGNNSANTKGSALQVPQAQKHGSTSILEGLRTPFASLFSSFKKSKKQHLKPPEKQQQNSLRYDHLTAGAHTSFKAKEMATIQTCNSSLPSEPTNKCLDANIVDMMDNTSTWNEELENELLKVLDSLDNQLAQEQSQDTMNGRTPTEYGSTVPEIHQHSIVMQPDFLGEVQRNDQNSFLADRMRMLRAKDKYNTFFRPRRLYDTYIKQHHTEKYTYGDLYDKRSSALKRGYSTCSLGHSSKNSLELPSGSHSSGFGPKNIMSRDTMGRSYSLSCLTRHSPLMSADKFSTSSLQHGLESNMDFTEANFQHRSRRTPLSSIVWNMPQSSRHSLHPDRLRRTQSLTEFNSAFEDSHPCSPAENTRYKLYRSKMNYRKVVPNTSHFLFTDRRIDPLCFDNRENYVSYPLKNISKSCYRYPSFHGKMNPSQTNFPFGRREEYLFRRNNHQYFSDTYHVPDVNFEQLPTNLGDRQSDYGGKKDIWQSDHMHNHASEYTRTRDHSGRGINKLFLKRAKDMQKCPAYVSAALENQTECAAPSQSQLSGDSQAPSKIFVKSFQTKKNSKILGMEGVSNADQSDKVDSMDIKKPILSQVFGQVNTNNPTESQVSPSAVSPLTTPPTTSSLQPPFILNSKRQAKANSLRRIENVCLSKIHSRNGQRKEDNCVESKSVEQACPPLLITNPTKLSILQSSPQEEHQLETLKAFNPNKMLNGTYSSDFNEDPKVLPNNEFPVSYAETLHKPNRFVRYPTSNSISGSPSNSPLKSPITYKTLHRKSASTDGSDLSKKRISPPTKKILFRNKRMVGDNLEAHISNRIGNIYSSKGEKNSFLSSSCSSLNISPKEMADEKNKKIKDYHMQLTQVPNCRSGGSNIIGSKRKKGDGPEKTAISVFSEKGETEAGNPLKQYKTTSTLTVSIEEDNVKYHELISVYYALPPKHSNTLCNVFLEDTKKTDSSSSPEKSQAVKKEYEALIGMTTVASPSNLEKGEKVISPDKMPTPLDVQQDSKNADDPDKDLQVPNPTLRTAGTSPAQCTMHNREEIIGPGAEEPALAFSSRPAVDGFPGDPKPNRIEAETVNTVTSALSNLRIGKHSSPWTEAPKLDKNLHLNSLNSKSAKTSLGNISAVSSAINVQKGSLCGSQPSAETSATIPPSDLTDFIQDGRSTAYPEDSTPVNASKEKNRNAAEVKERARYICRIISERGHGFQPRNESVGNEASVSKIKMHSDFQNSTLPGDAAFSVNPVVQPKGNMVECSKPQQQEMPPNHLLHKVCTNPQRSERICVDNQNFSSKDQYSGPAQDLPEHSLPENKLVLDCIKDKVSDIEKRKNRSSIKNKLAAMYKTSRKFSSKKSSSPKPHVSCIFSQNDELSLDNSNHYPMLISPDDSQQTGNENQNQASLPGEFHITRLSKVENKKLQTNEDRRPFTNLCNQKREHSGQSDKNTKTTQNSTILFPKSIMPVLNNNLQTGSKVLENNNYPIFSKCTVMDSYPTKRSHSNVGEPSSFPLLSDKHSYIKNDSKANIYPLQKLTSQAECEDYQDNEQSDIFKNVNQPCVKPVLKFSKTQRERHFSECSYTQKFHDHLTPKSSLTQPRCRRKFKSYSELLSCDENENWDTYNKNNRNFGSRRIMYPSIEFGIFGKEQQQAFLDNIKRSLTEGRLWNPCLLKNHRSITNEDRYSLSGLELLKSRAAEEQFPNEPLDFHDEASAYSSDSDSDSDTTTDDEYYLHEYEKESEL
ncbi:exophilin-5 isoform X1 [Python bivittatus]|uniref:Exophilin-5 isoform X1 n=2 Tax=Python bivittatus TaxID=176946 RepID=A0A9F2WBJ2_PYTBI|nr:exophilin-5 isoform X1 [Python bivittatus]